MLFTAGSTCIPRITAALTSMFRGGVSVRFIMRIVTASVDSGGREGLGGFIRGCRRLLSMGVIGPGSLRVSLAMYNG